MFMILHWTPETGWQEHPICPQELSELVRYLNELRIKNSDRRWRAVKVQDL